MNYFDEKQVLLESLIKPLDKMSQKKKKSMNPIDFLMGQLKAAQFPTHKMKSDINYKRFVLEITETIHAFVSIMDAKAAVIF